MKQNNNEGIEKEEIEKELAEEIKQLIHYLDDSGTDEEFIKILIVCFEKGKAEAEKEMLDKFEKMIDGLKDKIKKCGNLRTKYNQGTETYVRDDTQAIIVLEYIEELKQKLKGDKLI